MRPVDKQLPAGLSDHLDQARGLIAAATGHGGGQLEGIGPGLHRARLALRRGWDRADRSGGEKACWPAVRGAMDGDGRPIAICSAIGHRGALARLVRIVTDRRQTLPDPGMQVRHVCPGGGDPRDVNPRHLLWGDREANARDRALTNRGQHIPGPSAGELVNLDVLDVDLDVLVFLARLEAILARVRPASTPPEGCYVYGGLRTAEIVGPGGTYPTFQIAGERWSLPRLVLHLMAGPPEPGQVVLHTCDRKSCLAAGARHTGGDPQLFANPGETQERADHLSWGTSSANTTQAFERGLLARGGDHPRAVYTSEDRTAIMMAFEAGASIGQLVGRHGGTARTMRETIEAELEGRTGATVRLPRRRRLSPSGVHVVRRLAVDGLTAGDLQPLTGLTQNYLADLATGRARPTAPGPLQSAPGRARGARVATAKLDPDDIPAILQQAASGVSFRELGRRNQVDPSTIARAVHGRTWTHLTAENGTPSGDRP